jgi:hypothetical protein
LIPNCVQDWAGDESHRRSNKDGIQHGFRSSFRRKPESRIFVSAVKSNNSRLDPGFGRGDENSDFTFNSFDNLQRYLSAYGDRFHPI